MNSAANEIISCLEKSLGKPKDPIQLHEPEFSGNELAYVKECIDTGWVSSVGKFVDRFEQKVAEVTQSRFAVATANGTCALHLAYMLADVQRDYEVLMPSLTFVATANAASYIGAIPHFVDVSTETLGVDPEKLDSYLKQTTEIKSGACVNKKTGRVIKALVVMHTFGHPVDLDKILEVTNRYSLVLIEDSAEAIGAQYKGRHVGRHGKISALSFNGNKIITTGGGGAIHTDDEKLAKRGKYLATTAREKHAFEFIHHEVGYNYRMPNINAALGCAQLENLERFVSEKRQLVELYKTAFANCNSGQFFVEPPFARSNYWLNALILNEPNLEVRNAILEATNKAGFATRPVWVLMHHLPMYKNCPRMDLAVSERLEKTIINLPSSPFLGRGRDA